jgi:hypothetical protein
MSCRARLRVCAPPCPRRRIDARHTAGRFAAAGGDERLQWVERAVARGRTELDDERRRMLQLQRAATQAQAFADQLVQGIVNIAGPGAVPPEQA